MSVASKITLAGVALILTGLLVTATLRNPAASPDVSIVKGVKPLTWALVDDGSTLPKRQVRSYSMHMPFDEAVKAVDREMTAKSWIHETFYEYAMFSDGTGSKGESVRVERGRFVEGIAPPKLSHRASHRATSGPVFPDPHGWVTITTTRSIGPIIGLARRMRKALSKPVTISYCVVRPAPQMGTSTATMVDVNAGTSHLEGDGLYISFFVGER
jgi:hypothetical protein